MELPKNSLLNYNFEKIVDTIIRLGVLFVIMGWCFDVLQPFVYLLIWGALIAIAIFPAYSYLVKLFRGRKVIASLIITLILLSVLVVPCLLLMESLINGIDRIRQIYHAGQPLIPPPGESTKSWPVITKPLIDFWQLASENFQAAAMKYKDQLKEFGGWMFAALAGIGKGVLQFLASILLAGVFLVYSDSITISSLKIFKKLAGDSEENFVDVTVSTIRSVVKGILGVAVIQAALAGIGFFVAGVPFAGLWTILCLILAIVQVGAGPVAIPIAIYMFSVSNTLTATLFAAWVVIVVTSDNVLKPLLLGRGAPVPMLVVFMGSIGGFIYTGFLGLFLGAVILSIGYKLFTTWYNSESES